MTFGDLLRVAPGSTPDLEAIETDATPGFEGDKDAGRDRLKELRAELSESQERLWAESKQSWFVIPADKKWYRDLAVAEILAETAREMDPQWPDAEEDVSGIVIPE
jgi:hypothetical protein